MGEDHSFVISWTTDMHHGVLQTRSLCFLLLDQPDEKSTNRARTPMWSLCRAWERLKNILFMFSLTKNIMLALLPRLRLLPPSSHCNDITHTKTFMELFIIIATNHQTSSKWYPLLLFMVCEGWWRHDGCHFTKNVHPFWKKGAWMFRLDCFSILRHISFSSFVSSRPSRLKGK